MKAIGEEQGNRSNRAKERQVKKRSIKKKEPILTEKEMAWSATGEVKLDP